MQSKGRFYGFFMPSANYHEYKDCPGILHAVRAGKSEVREYGSERQAALLGHVRRCKLCVGRKMFEVDGGKNIVRMKESHHKTLCAIAELSEKKTGLVLRDIAAKCGYSSVTAYYIVKHLRAAGLVEHKLKKGGYRASGRSIIPTALGLKVVKTKALDETFLPK